MIKFCYFEGVLYTDIFTGTGSYLNHSYPLSSFAAVTLIWEIKHIGEPLGITHFSSLLRRLPGRGFLADAASAAGLQVNTSQPQLTLSYLSLIGRLICKRCRTSSS